MTDDPIAELADEFLERVRRGDDVSPAEYAARHPDLAAEILDLFPALLALEQARTSGDVTLDQPATPTPPPERLGEYRILREIGRGGMGVVYEAVQESLGRHVALKVLPSPPPGKEQLLERFRREARAAARLHHTNIVPVFGVGSENGVNFYVMQYIHGQPLDDVLAEVKRMRSGVKAQDNPVSQVAHGLITDAYKPPSNIVARHSVADENPASPAPETPPAQPRPPRSGGLPSDSSLAKQPEARYFRACAKLAQQAAEALAYAHAQGVLHRDVKPSNLLLDVHGTAWVTDFGLAKLDDDANLTQSGDLVGTLRYMAPERFAGGGDARSDVYALGITLYEMLTLRPAFDAKDRLALIKQVTESSPPPPRALDKRIPRDLDTIVRKATARDAGERYRGAADLADDLGRCLEDRAIKARRQGVIETTWKWARRRPAAVSLLLVTMSIPLIIVAVVGLVNEFWSSQLKWKDELHQQQQFMWDRGAADEQLVYAIGHLRAGDQAGFRREAAALLYAYGGAGSEILRLAIGDNKIVNGFLDTEVRRALAHGGHASGCVALLSSTGALTECATIVCLSEVERQTNRQVSLFVLSDRSDDFGSVELLVANPRVRSALAIRRGRAVDHLGHFSDPGAVDYLFQALSDLNCSDVTAARRQLGAAETWLMAPSNADSAKTNCVALDNFERLRVEILRREVRTKLGLNPDEPLK